MDSLLFLHVVHKSFALVAVSKVSFFLHKYIHIQEVYKYLYEMHKVYVLNL